jgi:serralysin
LSTLVNVQFAYDEANANIEFGTNAQTASAGYANYPLGNGANPSSLMMDNSNNTANEGANLGTIGGYGWQTLIHEIGHAMGLKHPGSYNAGGGTTPPPYLPKATDNRAMSIMSYNNPVASNVISLSGTSSDAGYTYSYSLSTSNPGTYQTYDLAALQYLYGANTSTVGSDLSFTNSYSSFQTVWAPQSGGVTLNASSVTRANLFDLREGGYSSIGLRSTDADKIAEIKDKFTELGFSSTNATAAANAAYNNLKLSKDSRKVTLNKTLYDGKNNLALAYGSKFSSVKGGSSTDKFYVSSYNATIDGGAGSDTVYLPGTIKDWTVDANKTTATAKSGTVISLQNIEAIAFYKATEALVRTK